MEKITLILDKKEPHLHSISPDATAEDALAQMCCENVDYLAVMDEDERFMGLITEHDIVSKVMFPSRSMNQVLVKEIMTDQLPSVTTEDTVERCMQQMRQHQIRYLAVFENFRFRGIVSSDDILDEAVRNRNQIFDTEVSRAGRFGFTT